MSIKGGSQEIAAIIANMNKPDFPDTFSKWLESVIIYPKAFDFRYESITSILDINVKTLFTYALGPDGLLCKRTPDVTCEFGTTFAEFEEIWSFKLRALKFAITMYLKEKNDLSMTKFFIEKGDHDCRFNILNYLSPLWTEIASGGQEYRITFLNNIDSESLVSNQSSHNHLNFRLSKNDEIVFMKREDFWLARHSDERFSYHTTKVLNEPFKSLNRSFINVFGLILEYQESDATVFVVDIDNVINQFSAKTGCAFLQRTTNEKIEFYFKEGPNDDFDIDKKKKRFLNDDHLAKCQNILKILNWNVGNILNYSPYYRSLWSKMVGVVDYVDSIQAVLRTWDLPFAVLPCRLKWSNNLMIVLSRKDDHGKCLKFTAATDSELFVVIATTPSDQKTWYTIQITTRGVILYRVSVLFVYIKYFN